MKIPTTALNAIACALVFSACAQPQITMQKIEKIDESKLKLVLIKNDKISFYDFGYLQIAQDSSNQDSADSARDSGASEDLSESSTESRLEKGVIASLDLFRFGNLIGRFVVRTNDICFVYSNINDCAPKSPASKAFFGKSSYGDLFEDILRKRDIFEGMGKQLEQDGTIIQRFHYGDEEIYYERKIDTIYFKNLTNGVTISIEDYKK